MQIAELGSAQIHWREDGDRDGIPVLFANSLGTDLRLWDKLIPRLPRGLRLIRYDKSGHGLSSLRDDPFGMDVLVDEAEALIETLDLGRVVFVGLSIGGMIGQGLAARRPDLVTALVLSNSAAKMGAPEMWRARISAIEAGGLSSAAPGILERWFAPGFRATPEAQAWRAMLERTPKAGYLACCHAIAGADLTETTRRLTLPTLGIAGSEDGASPPDVVEATTALIPGAQFHVVDGAGHLPCVEKPDDYAAILTPFLKEVCNV